MSLGISSIMPDNIVVNQSGHNLTLRTGLTLVWTNSSKVSCRYFLDL